MIPVTNLPARNSFQGRLNISLTWPQKALGENDCNSRWEWSKKHALAKAVGPLGHPPFTTGKTAANLTHVEYSQYVSTIIWQKVPGGFFRHSLSAFIRTSAKASRR